MNTTMPYRAGADQEDDQDIFARKGLGGVSHPVMDDGGPQQELPPQKPSTPKPYTPPAAPQQATPDDTPQPQTFAEKQAVGQARPPMPETPDGAMDGLRVAMGGPAIDYANAPGPAVPAAGPDQAIQGAVDPKKRAYYDALEPDVPDTTNAGAATPTGAAGIRPVDGILTEGAPLSGTGSALGNVSAVAPTALDSTPVTDQLSPPVAGSQAGTPSAVDSLLPTLLAGVNGRGAGSDVQNATNAAILKRLQSPSPYNSDAVKAEYTDLASGVDADYDARQRGLDDEMARRGLWGSVGKDFASGRAADTEAGRRSAKTSLARDLANKYATTAGDYESSAINQGMAGAGATNANSLNWLKTLFGYGQQGFENDLDTARFNESQDQNSQDFLLRMLAAGYGA